MTTFKAALGIAATCSFLGVAPTACGDDDGAKDDASSRARTQTSRTENARTEATASKERRRGSSVKVMNTRYGPVLFDGRGRALYLFTREAGSSRSRCYGDCASAWPPFFTRGKPRAGSGAKSGLLGTTKRRDGKAQVTYNGRPLYYYVTDRKPGQVTCQDVAEFGGTWLVVSPSGKAIR
jgi:predicted lipoprotein with Yx(FWY)xxD motif